MAESFSMRASTQVTQLVRAPREAVYRAFLDRDMVAVWQHPENMRLHMHSFDPSEGGTFRISLAYQDVKESPDGKGGKSSGDTDTYHGRFERLVPPTTIVQMIEFETDQPEFAGEMCVIVSLADVDGGTEVAYRCEDIPPGVRPEDNIAGCRSALQRLAALVERPER